MNVRVRDGKLLVRCFASCPQLEVIDSLRDAGLWPDTPREPFHPSPQLLPGRPVITRHPYYDRDGQLVAVHVRKDFGNGRKSMPWELPDGRVSQNGDINTANLPLYGLPNVMERLDKAVILVEGEKAADAATAEGLVAVSLSGGANQPDFGAALEALRGRHVLLWPDNDRPGLDLMLRVEEQLKGIAARIQWLNVPDQPLKGDAADYFSTDRTVDDLRGYVANAPPRAHAETAPRRFKLLTADELKNRPDPEWIVDGVVQKDTLALIVGAQETFKSFIGLDLAMSISEGKPWQGHACQQGVTVYISAEGGSGIGLRVTAWEMVRDTAVKHCLFLPDQAPQFLSGSKTGDVEELLLSLSDIDDQITLIVVDTLARVMVGHDENSVEHMGMLIATADRIRQCTGATVLFVHHNNKQGGTRGSTSLTGAVHTIIECSREQNSKHVVVRCGKQKDADHFSTMILEANRISLGVDEVSGNEKSSLVLDVRGANMLTIGQIQRMKPASMHALQVLLDLELASFAQWRDGSGLAKTTFHDARHELIQYGYVVHNIDGTYQPSDLGRVGGSVEGRWRVGRPSVGGGSGGSERGSERGGPLKGGAPDPPTPRSPTVDSLDLPWPEHVT